MTEARKSFAMRDAESAATLAAAAHAVLLKLKMIVNFGQEPAFE
jgi:hypothetical protein